MKIKKVNKRKNEKGITLVALVVTIVVLLILAAISINLILSDGGIIERAKKSEKDTERAVQEDKDLARGKMTVGDVTYNSIEEFMLERYPKYWNGQQTESPEFKENKDKGVWDWYIYTNEQLKFLSNYVNKTLTEEDQKMLQEKDVTVEEIAITKDTTIYLMNDLNLCAVFNDDGELISGKEWVPIGKEKTNQLLGTFEGNNHYICGVYVNQNTTFNGIFGNANTIRNLTIKNSYIGAGGCSGGIAGALRGGSLENCHNINTTVVMGEGNYSSVGGIVGQSQTDKIEFCTNSGNVYSSSTAKDLQCGGICGVVLSNSCTINNCSNVGEVKSVANGNQYVGGIIGGVGNTTIEVRDCFNTGNVTGTARIGGICGIIRNKY